MGSSVWSQGDGSQEPLRTYCQACWKGWGKLVKPGCKYELSSSCEQLAIQLKVKFLFGPYHSQPFKCTLCGSFFSNRTLETHLRQHHDESQQSAKDAGAEVPPPVIYVPGCSECSVSNRIKGIYVSSELHNGRPLYRKVRQEGSDVADVAIYYHDPNNGKWYIGGPPDANPLVAYAFSSSRAFAPGGAPLPLWGWWVRAGEGMWVFNAMRIIAMTSLDQPLFNEKHVSGVEVIWQFLAGDDGCSEDWQPVSQEMQAELEKHWAEGWKGENGSGTFLVKTKEGTYSIDCRNMAQRNLSTQRRCPIRREHKFTPAILQRMLAKQQSLQREIETHLTEREQLNAKVAELEKENSRLQSVRLEFASKLAEQEPWRMGRQLDLGFRVALPEGDGLFSSLQAAIRRACPDDHHGDCNVARQITITGLEHIRNLRLWKNYEFRKEQLRKELEGKRVHCVTSALSACEWSQLEPGLNETGLF